MKNILLPTDFSENSWNAIVYAMELFHDEVCTFYLLNTYTPVIYHVEYVLGYPAQFGLEDTIRNSAQQQLKGLRARIFEKFGHNPKHDIQEMARFDNLISGITGFMETHTIHMIVMGTKGATGAKEVLFGSNTVHVFKNVKCPVLAIPEGFAYKKPSAILFPTDYGISYQINPFTALLTLAQKQEATIHVLHVLTTVCTEAQFNNKARLEHLLLPATYQIHEVQGNDVMQAILNVQEHFAIDLLVMINNKKSFFENIFFKSTVNQIGFHLTIPFLVVPSEINNPN
ncbi:universal stress protein [Gelidibacter salicanalis]|uniref:Universal stress protein n=1 Tax=Gelidibacter salicanalis TaxID=291193 RepID=A0A5C7AXK1_9FLAO|nr:universal stress protein [Gelidibacter salicanalis]TXE10462.1 universal stress protein [Gelidibacter salicanalis]